MVRILCTCFGLAALFRWANMLDPPGYWIYSAIAWAVLWWLAVKWGERSRALSQE